MKHIDLFSGIGGFALAARWAGIETVQFVEIDKFCQKVLAKNFKGVPIHDDIKTFTYTTRERLYSKENERELEEKRCGEFHIGEPRINERPFILTGGFPCQPFSCAGKRKGTGDDRHLWPYMLRVIQETNPEWIIGENVGGIVNIKNMEQQDSETDMEDETFAGGEDCGTTSVLISILDDLEACGYSVQIFIIPACAVNAPHRRDRVWIIGQLQPSFIANSESKRNRNECTTISRSESNSERWKGVGSKHCDSNNIVTAYAQNPVNSRMRGRNNGNPSGSERSLQVERPDCDAPDTNRTGCGTPASGTDGNGQTVIKKQYEPQYEHSGQDCHAADTGGEGLQGCEPGQPIRLSGQPDRSGSDKEPDWSKNWLEVATRLCRVDDGVPRKLDRVNRLKALGNAIVPQIAFEIMMAIKGQT